jgi:hypothetical protein
MLLSDEVYAAIGRVTVNFQMLEAAIMMTTGAMISSDPKSGQIITSQLSFNRLCTTLDALVRHRVPDPALQASLDSALHNASLAEDQRNTILHSIYLAHKDAGRAGATRAKITVRRGKGIRVELKDMDAESINTLADSILEAWDEFVAVMTALETRGIIGLSAA